MHTDTNVQLITNRLILRPLRIGDAEAVFAYRADAVANRYQGFIPRTIEDVHEFITEKCSRTIDVPDTWFQCAIVKKEGGELIGDVGMHFLPDDQGGVEVGCTLDKDHHHRGYAVEALREVVRFLFTSLDKQRIIASIDPRNTKSVALVGRIGFVKARAHDERILVNGEWVDDAVYVLVRE